VQICKCADVLMDGKLTIRGGSAGKEADLFIIKGGVVEASNNKVVVLAEGIEQK
jgi:F-type H+-transporting ATPase subunit epsilon